MTEVLWREWGDAAFLEARELDRPILLDIGAVWCHWCHVMDHGIPGDPVHTGTYSNPEIADAINRDYIPIKVDNDRRPDINARYNMGGWPTTAFLTPSGDPLYGATYLTPHQMAGLLESIAEYYRNNKDEIELKLAEYSAKGQEALIENSSSRELTSAIAQYVAGEIRRSFDRAFGGFGTQPKFPHPDALNFTINQYAVSGDEEQRRIAEKTILEMASGGMYDQFAGGFFRYSTTRDWSIPHYEKMLQDNSRLLSTCLLAYQVFKDDQFKDIAVDVKRFLTEVMLDIGTGTFAGSQDADKEDEYYGRPLTERELLPTPFIDRTVYLDWNALAITAFVELYKQLGDRDALLIAIRLYEFLTTHVAPYHYYADSRAMGTQNQLTDITALLGAALDLYEVSGTSKYLSDARGLADVALTELYSHDVRRFRDIPQRVVALGALAKQRFDQEDNAHIAQQLVRLSAHSGSARYFNVAESVLKSFVGEYQQQSYFSSAYAIAVGYFLAPPVHVVLVGDIAAADMEELKFAAYRTFVLSKTVEIRTAETAGEYLPDPDGRSLAYVCVGTTCSSPVSDPAVLTKLLNEERKIGITI